MLYIKRDDETSRLYGGNKVRKLEFLLADVQKKRADSIVTAGAYGSHHLLATTLFAQSLGLSTTGIIFPQPMHASAQKTYQNTRATPAKLIFSPSKYLVGYYLVKTLLKEKLSPQRNVYYIPGGGSCALGALGYVNAGIEFAHQLKNAEIQTPQAIFIPFGTGATVAGLAAGLSMMGLDIDIIAIRVVDKLIANRFRLITLLKGLKNLILRTGGPTLRIKNILQSITIDSSFFGKGYATTTSKAEEAINIFQDYGGIRLEPTYTGKTAAAFLDYARHTNRPLVFWNTYASNGPSVDQ